MLYLKYTHRNSTGQVAELERQKKWKESGRHNEILITGLYRTTECARWKTDNQKKDKIGREKKKITMKKTLHMEIHGNSGNDYLVGNIRKEQNNWK